MNPPAPSIAIATALALLAGAPAQQQGDTGRVEPNPTCRIATHYFYWYRWPDEHFPKSPIGPAGHLDHFVDQQKVSYTDPDWHKDQFTAMAECGIEIALPVYWGAPGAYDKPDLSFSRRGLAPMVQALTGLEAAGKKGVTLGLFYDTSTLLCDVRGVPPRGGKADLRTAAGRRLFTDTVLGFFAGIPARHWARVDGAVLVVLYSASFAAGFDRSLGGELRARFTERFAGERVFLVADRSWGDIGQDLTTGWGAALSGPVLLPGAAQIGPGYDDSPVSGRTSPTRDREGGDFYRWSWRRAIASRPRMVFIETFNEMHEGTEICESRELGKAYLDLTREWIGRLRRGDLGPEIRLRHPRPKPHSDRSWGGEATGAETVFADYTGSEPQRFGLREREWEDGPLRILQRTLRPRGPIRERSFVYFQVADAFRFDADARLQVIVDLAPVNGRDPVLHYDSRAADLPHHGAYREVSGTTHRIEGDARRIVFDLPGARFANRQNGLADFRLCLYDVRTALRRVEVRPVPR